MAALANPSWAQPATTTRPGGNRVIAFSQPRLQDATDGPGDFVAPDVFTVQPGGGGTRRLTHDGDSSTPAFSPDGRSLVAAGAGAGPLHLIAFPGGALRDRDGGGSTGTSSSSPSWQPVAR